MRCVIVMNGVTFPESDLHFGYPLLINPSTPPERHARKLSCCNAIDLGQKSQIQPSRFFFSSSPISPEPCSVLSTYTVIQAQHLRNISSTSILNVSYHLFRQLRIRSGVSYAIENKTPAHPDLDHQDLGRARLPPLAQPQQDPALTIPTTFTA